MKQSGWHAAPAVAGSAVRQLTEARAFRASSVRVKPGEAVRRAHKVPTVVVLVSGEALLAPSAKEPRPLGPAARWAVVGAANEFTLTTRGDGEAHLVEIEVLLRGIGPMKAMAAALAALVWIGTAGRVSAATCDSLGALPLSNGKVTAATLVAPGAFVPPGQSGPGTPAFKTLPEFCRITASLTPTADSDIRIEVWLPAAGWNGKFQAVGNGGWAGVIPYPALAAALAAGYATAATDTGHVGNTAAFVPGHREKLVDYGYRAVHEMTVAAKAIIGAYHGNGPRVSYWNGCSTGGRQGLMEALRYPADYDGIIAGAPVNYRTHQLAWELWVAQAVHADERSYIPPAKYPGHPCRGLECLRRPRRRRRRADREPAQVLVRPQRAGVQTGRRRLVPDPAAGRSGP